ncbi:hypothetical protein BaRGS_00030193 [Batillaria attramentaria]|uniref:Laminin EGF-like domain-containing protein n=1 Tax=Batillaria attramentaria TaxID=370345 RepID=A0ABD0JU59_9CAEN
MSSAWLQNGARSDCHAAINGNNDIKFQVSSSQQNCIHTDRGDTKPLWWVDMLKEYTVYWIRLYVRSGQKERMTHLHVALDQQPVYDSGSDIPSGSYIDIHANNRLPCKGRNLTIGRTAASDHFINICEVRVWECADGYYGTDCQYTCGHCEGGAACDKLVLTEHSARTVVSSVGTVPTTSHVTSKMDIVSGVLMDGLVCADGTYGQNCGEQCGHCANNQPCDKQDGHCQGCATRWSGDLCKECPDGRYGQSCGYACGHCKDGAACNKRNGHCVSCDGTYAMPFCQEETALDHVTLGDATHEAEPASEDLEANYENTQFQRTHDTGPEPGASDSDPYERLQVQRGNQGDVSPYETLSLPAGQHVETPAAKKPPPKSKSAKRVKGTCACGENVYENTRFPRRK